MLRRSARLPWASHQRRALARLPALPNNEVIGGFYEPPQIPDTADSAFADIADLVTACQGTRDLAGFAALVSATAHRRLELRGPAQD
jgi:hypothetical protein